METLIWFIWFFFFLISSPCKSWLDSSYAHAIDGTGCVGWWFSLQEFLTMSDPMSVVLCKSMEHSGIATKLPLWFIRWHHSRGILVALMGSWLEQNSLLVAVPFTWNQSTGWLWHIDIYIYLDYSSILRIHMNWQSRWATLSNLCVHWIANQSLHCAQRKQLPGLVRQSRSSCSMMVLSICISVIIPTNNQ